MCGIVGILQRRGDRSVDQALLAVMRNTLQRRGPDDAGMYCQGPIGLGHQRLSILDVSQAGHQPMSTPDGRYTIVFNGEIYNYQQLAKQYLRDVSLVSDSDTEVLLHLLARHGESILPKLRGMFAFALWDTQTQTLLLARDPFGKKPLYYHLSEQLFLFASELKALLKHPRLSRQLDRSAHTKYFLYEYIPAPATPFSAIRQLPGGEWLKITPQGVTQEQWWQPHFFPKLALGEDEAQAKLDQLLADAVERRMISDVPVGIFLSGGLDSSTIAWYMKRLTASDIHSFSVSFREPSFNEGGYAAQAARAIGTVHHDILFTTQEFQSSLAALIPIIDTPLADASLLPTYAISQYARQHITVALDGDGSDELFGGYGTFTAAIVAEKLSKLPRLAIHLLQNAAALLPTRYHNFSFDFKIKSFTRGLSYPLLKRNQIWLGSFSEVELGQILTQPWQITESLWEDIEALNSASRDLAVFDTISLSTVAHYLSNDILVKLDRATMANSLEARTPFLDVDLARFIQQLPVALKQNKYLLKKTMEGRLSPAIIYRAKKGFGIPLGWWLTGPLFSWASDVLCQTKLAGDGILQPAAVRRLLEEHRRGKADHRKKLWTLLTWQLWYDHWVADR